MSNDLEGTSLIDIKNRLKRINYEKQNQFQVGNFEPTNNNLPSSNSYDNNINPPQNFSNNVTTPKKHPIVSIPNNIETIDTNTMFTNISKNKITNQNKKYVNKKRFEKNNYSIPNINNLVLDINKSLENYSPSSQAVPLTDEYEDYHEPLENLQNTKNENTETKDSSDYILLKEFLLLVIIYVILSQNFFRNFIGKYIKYINPKPDGNVSLIGVIIYGILFAIIYLIVKKFLI